MTSSTLDPRKRLMQVSIRSVLAHVTLFALCIAGWASGPPLAFAGTAILTLILIVYAINAAVGSRNTRSFAIGLLIPACAYLALTFFASENEYAAQGGRLPTTHIAQSLMQSRYSGKTMKIGAFSNTLDGIRDTLPLIHLSVALTLGYLGGFYASWVSRQQQADCGKPADAPERAKTSF